MNIKTNKSGFTLTEILIVLVIAGILLALILPNSVKAIAKGNAVAAKANVDSCNSALVMCFGETKSWASCKDLSDLETAGVIKTGETFEGAVIEADGAGYRCK